MNEIEPLHITPAEAAEWETAREIRKELENSGFIEHARKLGKDWE